MSNTPCGRIPLETRTTTSSAGCTRLPPRWKSTGSTPVTSAVATAWTPSASRPSRRTNSSSSSWLAVSCCSHSLGPRFGDHETGPWLIGFFLLQQMASSTSGPVAANAILTDATAPICSQPSSTDGSGPALRPRFLPPTSALSETGPTPAVMVARNPTTAKTM